MASRIRSFVLFTLLILSATCQESPVLSGDALPQVDLGYSVVQAVQTGSGLYSFNNIRYAEAPVGELRFAAPIPPRTVNRTVNDGSQSVICPQAQPDWITQLQNLNTAVDPRTSEDCLFLDVVVSQDSYVSRQEAGVLPVLVWIYGGGFTTGDKSAMVSGLLTEAKKSTSASIGTATSGIVFVAMNYRLGLFGWLSGPTFQSNGTANAGLYDQRLALHWVQQYIHLFGGDANQVTVMGESAGGGSVMHQITAYGGDPPDHTPFQKAILQSPGFALIPSNDEQEQIFQTFLTTANISSIGEARALSTEQLQSVNQAVVSPSPYGSYTFSPVVDGSFAPDLPGKLLLQGSYAKNLSLMLGHNSDEGALFTKPNATSNADFFNTIRELFPTVPTPIFNYINQELYPPIFNDTTGKYPYTNNRERSSLLFAESIFTCNTNYLARAFANLTYNYIFSIPPGIHGQDVAYTFYVPDSSAGSNDSTSGGIGGAVNATVATTLQDYITSFAVTGNPNLGSFGLEEGPALQFVMYGDSGRVQNLSDVGIRTAPDPAKNDRCLWWQKALYY